MALHLKKLQHSTIFDEELRTPFLKYILHVERQLKSMLSYYFCEKYGEQQAAYLDVNNYNVTRKTVGDITRLVNTLSKSISLPSHYRYITVLRIPPFAVYVND